jgi:hypothetical protein
MKPSNCISVALYLVASPLLFADDQPGLTATYSFSAHATGPFIISPVTATVVRDDQLMLFSSVLPFPLTAGYVQGFDNLAIPTFPARFFDGTFAWFGEGGDALFGTVTVQTSVFTDPVNPATGDFFGSEDFTGTFQIMGGTGRYLNASGSGSYSAHSDYRPPTLPGTLFSGSTTVTVTGVVTVAVNQGDH